MINMKKMHLLPAAILTIIGFLASMVATQAMASPGMQALQRFYSEVQSLDTEFNQVLLDDTGEIVQQGKGRFTLNRPNRFRWEYVEPYRQLMLSNGQTFWFYDIDLAQVTQRPAAQTLVGSPAALLAGGGNLNEQFEITDMGQRRDLYWVRLVPRQAGGDFSEIQLAFTQSQRPRLMELKDNLGQTTQITFDNLHVNPKISQRSFELQVPQGVEVVEDNLGLPPVSPQN